MPTSRRPRCARAAIAPRRRPNPARSTAPTEKFCAPNTREIPVPSRKSSVDPPRTDPPRPANLTVSRTSPPTVQAEKEDPKADDGDAKDDKKTADAAKKPPEDDVIKKVVDGVGIPLDIGARVQCKWRDGQMYPVRVIERRAGPKGKEAQEEYEYYVHYEQFNRRLDTWVTIAETVSYTHLTLPTILLV